MTRSRRPDSFERQSQLDYAFERLSKAEIAMLLHEYDPALLDFLRKLPVDKPMINLTQWELQGRRERNE